MYSLHELSLIICELKTLLSRLIPLGGVSIPPPHLLHWMFSGITSAIPSTDSMVCWESINKSLAYWSCCGMC